MGDLTTVDFGAAGRGRAGFEEHPRVTIADVRDRPRPAAAQIITVANEKGGVGKSTLAFHIAVALADVGYKVLAIDLDARQQSLARALLYREGTARRLKLRLPLPRQLLLNQPSGAVLAQEIARAGWDCDYVVIDVAGHDSAVARRAIAMANLLVSPINSSFLDLDLFARFDAVSGALQGLGCFAEMVGSLRQARRDAGMADLDWLVLPNRKRRDNSTNQQRFDAALAELARRIDFRLGSGLAERVAYRELFQHGLTHLDLKRVPQLARTKAVATCEVLALLDDLRIAEPELSLDFGVDRSGSIGLQQAIPA